MFSSRLSNREEIDEAVWAGISPVQRLLMDTNYAKQLAQSSTVCGVCYDLDLEDYPFALIRTVNGVERREATIENTSTDWSTRNIKNCGFCAIISDAIKIYCPDFYWGATFPRLCSITMIQDEPILLTIKQRLENCDKCGASSVDPGLRPTSFLAHTTVHTTLPLSTSGKADKTRKLEKFGIEIYREPHVLVPSLRYLGAASKADSVSHSLDLTVNFTLRAPWMSVRQSTRTAGRRWRGDFPPACLIFTHFGKEMRITRPMFVSSLSPLWRRSATRP